MARRTHKMIGANDSVRGTGMPSQANSITAPSSKVFVTYEDSLPATTVQDIINNTAFIDNAVSTDNQISAGDDDYSLNIGSLPGGQVGGKPAIWVDPVGDDWLYFGVMRAKVDPALPSSGYAVYLQHAISNDHALRIFPYMMLFRDSSGSPYKEVVARNIDTEDWSWMWNGSSNPASGNGWYCDNCEGWNLVEDQVYSIGGARRGDWMEHYFDGELVGRVNVRDAFAGTAPNPPSNGRETDGDIAAWEGFDGGGGLELTHSGYSDVGCIDYNGDQMVGHYPADHYGIHQFVFAGGLPSQENIEYWMDWMKEEWQKGNKIAPPEWMTL